MKYFTQNWYDMVDKVLCMSNLVVVPDGTVTFKELYSKKMDEFMKKYKKSLKNYQLKNKTQEESKEESNKLDGDEIMQFSELFVKIFKDKINFDIKDYKNRLKLFSDEVRKTVDVKKLALGYIDESAYKLMQKETENYIDEINRIKRNASGSKRRQKIDKELKDKFYSLYEKDVLSCKKDHKNYVLCLSNFDDKEEPLKITLVNARVIEKSRFRTGLKPNGFECYAYVMDNELYKLRNNRYQVHFLFTNYIRKYDFIVECDDVIFE